MRRVPTAFRGWTACAAVLLAAALLMACDPPEEAVRQEPAPAVAAPLTGTWETDPLPLARVRSAHVAAGGGKQAAVLFVAQLHATTWVQFRLEVTERGWREFVRADSGAAVPGWSGTYVQEGSTVHVVDDAVRCDLTVEVEVDGDRLRPEVQREVGGRRDCGRADLTAARTIHSSAPYVRTAACR
ncbi:hypothetical protein [Geodermatophilus sp. SYSU D00815]